MPVPGRAVDWFKDAVLEMVMRIDAHMSNHPGKVVQRESIVQCSLYARRYLRLNYVMEHVVLLSVRRSVPLSVRV